MIDGMYIAHVSEGVCVFIDSLSCFFSSRAR